MEILDEKFVTPLIISAVVIALLLVVRWYTGQHHDDHAGHDHAPGEHHAQDEHKDQNEQSTAEASTGEAQTGGKVVGFRAQLAFSTSTRPCLEGRDREQLRHRGRVQNSTNPVIFAGMDSGAMHVHPEGWLPNHANLHKKYVDENKTVLQGKVPTPADQAICTTKDTMKNTGITKLEELAKPDMAAKFDSDGDGKGEMWIGATGWASTNVEKIRAKSYGYDQTMQLKEMDETLALADIDAAVAKQSNIVFYCYSPHHTFMMYDLQMLKEEPHDPAQWNVLQPTDDPRLATEVTCHHGLEAGRDVCLLCRVVRAEPSCGGKDAQQGQHRQRGDHQDDLCPGG